MYAYVILAGRSYKVTPVWFALRAIIWQQAIGKGTYAKRQRRVLMRYKQNPLNIVHNCWVSVRSATVNYIAGHLWLSAILVIEYGQQL